MLEGSSDILTSSFNDRINGGFGYPINRVEHDSQDVARPRPNADWGTSWTSALVRAVRGSAHPISDGNSETHPISYGAFFFVVAGNCKQRASMDVGARLMANIVAPKTLKLSIHLGRSNGDSPLTGCKSGWLDSCLYLSEAEFLSFNEVQITCENQSGRILNRYGSLPMCIFLASLNNSELPHLG